MTKRPGYKDSTVNTNDVCGASVKTFLLTDHLVLSDETIPKSI